MSASTIVDPCADRNKSELVRLSRLFDLPDFVKQADIDNTMHPKEPAVSVFADPVRKKFACHNAAATILSAVYFHDKSAEYPEKDRKLVQERLEKAADFFRVRPDYDAVVKTASDLHLRRGSPLPDSSYAYVLTPDDGGAKERYYPMTDAASVKVAADWLLSVRDRMPFEYRHVISNKILAKAADYGAGLGRDLDGFLEKQAGRGIPDPDEIGEMLQQRATISRQVSPEWSDAITKLAVEIKTTPQISLQTDALVKLASVVEELDHNLGIRGKYTDIIRRPEDVLFGLTFQKAASDYNSLCVLQTGKVYDKRQFGKVALDDVESLFGTDFTEAVSCGLEVDTEKFAAVASTLPRPDAEMLESLMQAAGQHPQSLKTASFAGLSDEVLAEAAAKYQRKPV